MPDPAAEAVAFLIKNPEALPREVTLLVTARFDVLANGAVTGNAEAKPGAKVTVTGIEPGYVTVSLGTASKRLPITSTDLAAGAPDAMRVYLNRLETKVRLEALREMAVPPAKPQRQTATAATCFAPRFVHPGIPLTKEDLAELKRNLGREPWKSGFHALQNDGRSKPGYKMRGPYEVVTRNPHHAAMSG